MLEADKKYKKELEKIANIISKLRKEGKKIVLCHGVFDLLHIGHIRYLRASKKLGDVLVVTMSPDHYVDKGPGRPAFSEHLRLEAIASLDCVDYAAINAWATAEETLRLLRPDIYSKGSEFKNLEDATGKIARENSVVEEIGATIHFVEDIVFSSSNLINQYLSQSSDECREYLRQFKQRYTDSQIFLELNRMKSLNVLVLGDMILDEYIYCSALGASSKDPVLAVNFQSSEVFAGGSAAIANHVAQQAGSVTLCSVLGDDNKENWIREHLNENIIFKPFLRPNSPTVRKQRIMDGYSFQKLIEVYHMEASPLPEDIEQAMQAWILEDIQKYDLVIAADFGHGCISAKLASLISEHAEFLAVNTQANAGNRGYHTISRYPRADFISLAGHEITLEYRNQKITTSAMMTDLQHRLSCPTVLVTEGRKGCAVLREDFTRAPSFASNVIDRVGAGDALFSIAAMGARLGFPIDLMGFCGNIAGSLAVETIGNAKAVSKNAMLRYITAILK